MNLHGTTPNGSVYISDTVTLPKHVNLTLSGRYNAYEVHNPDR